MNQSIFRSKSIESITAPEQLEQYIKVANPSIFLLLGGIITLLIGVCCWGMFGTLETTVPCAVSVENGQMTVYTIENVAQVGQLVRVHDSEISISQTLNSPVSSTEVDDYLSYLLSPEGIGYFYACTGTTHLADGIYPGVYIVEQINPIYFITN